MRHLRHHLAFALLSLLIMPSARGQLRLRARYVLTPTEVAQAISKALSKSVALPTVLLLADVTASEPNPQLDVDNVSPLRMIATTASEPQLVVRVTCHVTAVCLPFYAVVSWATEELPAVYRFANVKTSAVNFQRSQPIMRSGEHATLILEDRGTRLEIPVVSLQSGAEGQSIRAISLDHKHIYAAHVTAATVLKGSF